MGEAVAAPEWNGSVGPDDRRSAGGGRTGGRRSAALAIRRATMDQPLAMLEQTASRARSYAEAAKAPNTRRAYRCDWNDFILWCRERRRTALPATPDAVALYLTELAAVCKVSTLQRRLTSIAQAHQHAGIPAHESPTRHATVRAVWAGIRRAHGTAQEGKAPTLIEDVRAMVGTLLDTLLGVRDRALLLLGFAGAFRRSEFDVRDVTLSRAGLVVVIRKSKTDQEGEGQSVGIPYGANPDTCPVRVVQVWLSRTYIKEGALFRSVNRHGQLQQTRLSDKTVALVVKRAAAAAGLDATRYAGHSLRAGLATAASIAGAGERSIMNQTRHKSERMVRKYIRDGQLFRDNAAAAVGL
jgi:site-specific recombinase XerD